MSLVLMSILQTDAELRTADGLSAFGWTFMLLSMGAVTAFTIWSFARILRGQQHFDPDGTGPAHSPVPGREDRPASPDR